MKRSKALLISNILATIYAGYLLWVYGKAVIEAGGADFIEAVGESFEAAFELLGTNSPGLTLLYVILILLCVHIIAFTLGCMFGWIGYAGKKSGCAKFAATFYLIGTICFPLYLFFGLPITIVGFIGGSKQKKLNKINTAL